MPKLEIKRTSDLTRKQVSERLIALGKALASGSEVEGDETEIEIKWCDCGFGTSETAPATAPAKATPAKNATRARPRKAAAH